MTRPRHTERTALRLPAELMEWVRQQAAEHDRSEAYIIRRALERARRAEEGRLRRQARRREGATL